MLNIHDLESRHKKYKQKALIPYFAITASLVVSAISVAFFISYDFDSKVVMQEEATLKAPVIQNPQVVVQEQVSIQTPTAESSQVQLPPANKTLTMQDTKEKDLKEQEISTAKEERQSLQTQEEQIEEKVTLSPSLNFINNIKSREHLTPQKQNSAPAQKVNQEVVEKPIVAVQIPQEKSVATVIKEQEVVEVLPKQEAQNSINIKRKNDDDLRDVIKRFNNNHNPALSLFIAKKYYQAEDYKNAYDYALATNEINNNIEESWIIFSKSLVKLGKKEMAVETLKRYVDHSHSSQAKQLLEEILSGKFK